LAPELRLSEAEYPFAQPDTAENIVFEVQTDNDNIPLVKVCLTMRQLEVKGCQFLSDPLWFARLFCRRPRY